MTTIPRASKDILNVIETRKWHFDQTVTHNDTLSQKDKQAKWRDLLAGMQPLMAELAESLRRERIAQELADRELYLQMRKRQRRVKIA